MEDFCKTPEDERIDTDALLLGQFNRWVLFADAMRMPRHQAKRLAYQVIYGIETDPWVCHIVRVELDKLCLGHVPKPILRMDEIDCIPAGAM